MDVYVLAEASTAAITVAQRGQRSGGTDAPRVRLQLGAGGEVLWICRRASDRAVIWSWVQPGSSPARTVDLASGTSLEVSRTTATAAFAGPVVAMVTQWH